MPDPTPEPPVTPQAVTEVALEPSHGFLGGIAHRVGDVVGGILPATGAISNALNSPEFVETLTGKVTHALNALTDSVLDGVGIDGGILSGVADDHVDISAESDHVIDASADTGHDVTADHVAVADTSSHDTSHDPSGDAA